MHGLGCVKDLYGVQLASYPHSQVNAIYMKWGVGQVDDGQIKFIRVSEATALHGIHQCYVVEYRFEIRFLLVNVWHDTL